MSSSVILVYVREEQWPSSWNPTVLFVAYNNHPNERAYNLLVLNSASLILWGKESEHIQGTNKAFILALSKHLSEQSVLQCVTTGSLSRFCFFFPILFVTPADESRPTYVSWDHHPLRLVNAKFKSRLRCFEESSPRSDLTGGWCCFGKKGGGSQARGETAGLREIPSDRLYIIDCLSVYSPSRSSQRGNT